MKEKKTGNFLPTRKGNYWNRASNHVGKYQLPTWIRKAAISWKSENASFVTMIFESKGSYFYILFLEFNLGLVRPYFLKSFFFFTFLILFFIFKLTKRKWFGRRALGKTKLLFWVLNMKVNVFNFTSCSLHILCYFQFLVMKVVTNERPIIKSVVKVSPL